MSCCTENGSGSTNGSTKIGTTDKYTSVQEYYGKVLSSSKDLKTSACTAGGRPHPLVLELLRSIPAEVNDKCVLLPGLSRCRLSSTEHSNVGFTAAATPFPWGYQALEVRHATNNLLPASPLLILLGYYLSDRSAGPGLRQREGCVSLLRTGRPTRLCDGRGYDGRAVGGAGIEFFVVISARSLQLQAHLT